MTDYEAMIGTANEIASLLKEGVAKEQIVKTVDDFSDEAFSIAKARVKNERLNKVNPFFVFTEDDLRFCTNQLVAKYRAERLKCGSIVDVGCGIGIQALEFAKVCESVLAIEIEERKIKYAKYNAEIEKVGNVEFVPSDAIKALSKIKGVEIVFWDPERPASEAERGVESFSPSFDDMVDKVSRMNASLVIELPPQIKQDKIPGSCEFEYVSVNGELNRLSAYFGNLKKCDISIVSLPSKERIEFNGKKIPTPKRTENIGLFLYEVDNTIARSGLFDFYASSLNDCSVLEFGGKIYLTSESVLESAFLKRYKVVGNCLKAHVKEFLKENSFGSVILHGRIDETLYSKMRQGLQRGLHGKTVAHLFIGKDEVAICVIDK